MVRRLPTPQSPASDSPRVSAAARQRQDDGAERVGQPATRVARRLGEDARSGERDRGHDRHVDQEGPAPVAERGQGSADERTEGHAEGGGTGPAGRVRRAPTVTDGREQESQRGRGGGGRAEALESPPGQQHAEVGGDTAHDRAEAEEGETAEIGTPTTGPVGDPAGRHQGGGEDDGVGRDHPGHGGPAVAVEVGTDGRHQRVGDRDVERHQQPARRGHREDAPMGPLRGSRHGWTRPPGRQDPAHARLTNAASAENGRFPLVRRVVAVAGRVGAVCRSRTSVASRAWRWFGQLLPAGRA